MDFSRVLSELLVGSCPLNASDQDVLAKSLGVTAVLSLQTDEDLERLGCDWDRMRGHYRRLSITPRRVPVRDFDSEDLRAKLPECVRNLNELLREGHTVYVHCTAGMGRSPSVIAAYFHWMQPCELASAVRQIVSCHHCSPDVEAIRLASEDLLGE